MKKLTRLLIPIFCLAGKAFSQDVHFVEKDKRINAFQDSIISYLLEQKQFDINNQNFKRSEYEGKMFVKKCLEIFDSGEYNILLVKFGSLEDHANLFWGLLTNERLFKFSNLNDAEFKEFEKEYKRNIAQLVKSYINLFVNPTGSSLTSNYEGPDSGNSGSLTMAQRSFLSKPTVSYSGRQTGRVVVELRVDKNGKVIYVRAGARGTTITDPSLLDKCEDAVRNSSLNALENAPDQQSGTVTFMFKAQ